MAVAQGAQRPRRLRRSGLESRAQRADEGRELSGYGQARRVGVPVDGTGVQTALDE